MLFMSCSNALVRFACTSPKIDGELPITVALTDAKVVASALGLQATDRCVKRLVRFCVDNGSIIRNRIDVPGADGKLWSDVEEDAGSYS